MPVRTIQLLALLLLAAAPAGAQRAAGRPNVLFIFIDDLRPDLGCYGNTQVHSPHIDSLARSATVFRNQYAVVPTCGASRYSLLTGRYPRSRAALANEAAERLLPARPGDTAATFIEQLRRNGYYTVGIGKISHSADGYVYGYTSQKSDRAELPGAWDEMLLNPGRWQTGWNAFFAYADGTSRQGRQGMVKPCEAGEGGDTAYPDGLTANLAVQKVEELARRQQPFFLGVGFFKPHLPFNAPRQYWDLYDEASLQLTPSPGLPEGVNAASLHGSAEFNQYRLGDEFASLEKPLSDAYARKLRHGYYACISYIDAQVGKVLAALRRTGLDRNTIVVIWGDHGWHLGDDRVWGKHTIFEWALRSAFILKTPQQQQGTLCSRIVSAADIYPTLMELCGVKMPYPADGQSLARLLRNPGDKTWRNTAYGYFRQGITLRTERYRLTKYSRAAQPAIELYDHETDPWENRNIAQEQPALVQRLLKIWEQGNTGIW